MNESWGLLQAGAFAVIFVAAAVYARAIPQGGRRWWTGAALLAALVLVAVTLAHGFARVLLLDAASLLAAGLVWEHGTPEATKAAKTYLAFLVLAVLCIGTGLLVGGMPLGADSPRSVPPMDSLAVGLLCAGFALKLALVPFYFWLPDVAEHAAPMTTVLIISVVDMAAFSELTELRLTAPWIFERASGLWLGLAVLSMLGGAVLALAQRNLKRMLAFSTIDDMGYLLLGALAGPEIGLAGALIGALSHSFLKAVLFGAVGVAENRLGRPLALDDTTCRGLAARFPVSAAAFIVGSLGMIGVPPLVGFTGRWRLYLAGQQAFGPWMLMIMVGATALALLYYVRAIHQVWLGAPAVQASTTTVPAREPRLAAGVLAVLMVVVLVGGLFPTLLTTFIP